ncbi:CRISPR-associated protein Cas1 [Methanosarcina siciliae C2J]|uniref:CRISPR-associated protein Cas1 n=1 Tax=Methanosarcina siciliae C2J TaxID=1434118 RepID=A0A0E3PLG4_9EURY|nr:CRISPR-associated protein Cas1 [Methanosarcina siciliae C2J]
MLNKKVSYQGKKSTWSYVIFLKVRVLLIPPLKSEFFDYFTLLSLSTYKGKVSTYMQASTYT